MDTDAPLAVIVDTDEYFEVLAPPVVMLSDRAKRRDILPPGTCPVTLFHNFASAAQPRNDRHSEEIHSPSSE